MQTIKLRGDLGLWILTLEKEQLLGLDHFKLGLEGDFLLTCRIAKPSPGFVLLCSLSSARITAGPISGHLGAGKSPFGKMSLHAKKHFDEWFSRMEDLASSAKHPEAPWQHASFDSQPLLRSVSTPLVYSDPTNNHSPEAQASDAKTPLRRTAEAKPHTG